MVPGEQAATALAAAQAVPPRQLPLHSLLRGRWHWLVHLLGYAAAIAAQTLAHGLMPAAPEVAAVAEMESTKAAEAAAAAE